MSASLAISTLLVNGIVSRYVKPLFLGNNFTISPDLFDLRDGKPPEEFVSFFKVNEDNKEKNFSSAIDCLPFTPSLNGAMILLDVEESLEEVNDEEDNIISFTEQRLPHCGLIYLTTNLTKIQEAKTTLSYLATNRFSFIKDIKAKDEIVICQSQVKK